MMNTYANGTAALKMPQSYVPLTEEEMTYVDGGYSFLNDENYSDVRTDTKLVSAATCNSIAARYSGCATTSACAVGILQACGVAISAVGAGIVIAVCGMISSYFWTASAHNGLKLTVTSIGHYITQGRTATDFSCKIRY